MKSLMLIQVRYCYHHKEILAIFRAFWIWGLKIKNCRPKLKKRMRSFNIFKKLLILALQLEQFVVIVIAVLQSFNRVLLFVTPWTAGCQASLSFTISRSLLKLMAIELVMPFNHLILCHPFLLLTSIFPSIRVSSNESALRIRWPKYWSFSFNISPSNEYSGLISFRVDWLDLLAVQGTVRSLLQHHSLKHQFLSTQSSLWFNFHLHT